MNESIAAPAAEVLLPEGEGWEWMVVEIFGHRRHVGRVREEDRFGARMLRVDVPRVEGEAVTGWASHFYGGGSIFSVTPTDEASALRANRPYARPSPVALPAPYREDEDEDEFPEHDDHQDEDETDDEHA
ncbi:hypothetical protein ABE438_17630 [Bosea sp. TWI1241]|uniref:hypothetical protein n=1 Tax=Bosea sp. TWI1241 TaxID=3148904 RepID=UPI003207FF4F